MTWAKVTAYWHNFKIALLYSFTIMLVVFDAPECW